MPYLIGTDIESGTAPVKPKITTHPKQRSLRRAASTLPTLEDLRPILSDLSDRLAYTKGVYGGDQGTYWQNREAIDAQYDYNLRRAKEGKGVVTIADMAWDPDAQDDDTNEALGRWYRDKGSLPGAGHQSEFNYMRQEYSRQKAAGRGFTPSPASSDIRQNEPQTSFAPQDDLPKPGMPRLVQETGQGYTGDEARRDGAGAGYRHTKNAGDVLYPNTTLNPGLSDDGFNPLSLHDWKTLAGDVGNKFKAGFYGAVASFAGQPLNSLMGRDERVNIVIDGDRIGVLSTGNAGDKSDGKVRKKVSTDDGYTFVESELTEEELAKRLGYGSVKALKLALVNEDDYIQFMNRGNAYRDNVRQSIASDYEDVYDKVAEITGFTGSLLPGYGDGIDVKETITGEDIRTGEKLPLWQRGVTGAAMLLPFVSGGTIRSVIKGADEVSEIAEQTVKHGDELVQGAGENIIGTKHSTFMPTQEVINKKKVAEYSERLKAGEKIPPVQVIEVPGKGRYIIDGHHRYVASLQTGVAVEIKVVPSLGPIGMPDWTNIQWREYINEEQFWGD